MIQKQCFNVDFVVPKTVIQRKMINLQPMKISIIVPALNEEASIGSLVIALQKDDVYDLLAEIIVVDGGSKDKTVELVTEAGAKVINSSLARRSVQMNEGAKAAVGDVLYFLHADCLPPQGFLAMIRDAIESGKAAGCFRRSMKSARKKLGYITFTSKIPGRIFRGGDASLYIRKELFEKIDGFDPDMILCEDYEILKRLRPHTKFHVIPEFVLASDRKHHDNPSLKLLFANILVYSMFLFGFSQNRMLNTYRRMVDGTRYQ
jgi:rSAM/selenodomain-associated transferase 2